MNNHKNILIVDADQIVLNSVADYVATIGFIPTARKSLKDACKALRNRNYPLVITEMTLPDGDGFDLIDTVKKNYPQTVIISLAGNGTIAEAVKAVKQGAYDYLTKPIVDDDLRLAISRAIRQQSLMSENENLRSQLKRRYSLEQIVSQDYKMGRIFELVEAVADTNTTILMTGPSGTGKSMMARAIHERSSRRNKPFIEVSCGALPETLLESELFGHAKGAFTGAISNKQGKFLAADGGTIFLDEISNASPALQVKLLRVLEQRQFEPVGSNKTLRVDSRIILASNKDLYEQVQKGKFREDLYYRINVVTIELPPLRERVGDIGLLAKHFLKVYSAHHSRKKAGITDSALKHLEYYHWQGNIRELENTIERAVLLSKGEMIDVEDLPESVKNNNHFSNSSAQMPLKEALAEPEKSFIRRTLEKNQWNRQKTARALDINRTTLYKKMKKHNLYAKGNNSGGE